MSADGGARVIWDSDDVNRALKRIAHQVLESNRGAEGLVLLGIRTRGIPLARRLGAFISEAEGVEVPVGELDITMYRDDLRKNPTRAVGPTRIPVDLTGRTVVLVDDVLYSGRSIRAALDALNDIGRPAAVRLAILVDRGHRELPIRPDFVGKNLPSARSERVNVHLAETDGIEEVTIAS